MRIAIDVRPLTSTMTGIGRYTYNILSRLLENSPEHEWFLYAHRPLTVNLPSKPNIHIRTGNIWLNQANAVYAQIVFPIWAYNDKIDVFWSPRHHLPVLLPSKIKKIVTIQDIVWYRYPETMTRLGWLQEYMLMPLSIKISDHVLTISDFTKSELVSALNIAPDKITVTPLAPVDLPKNVMPELPAELVGKKFFLFVGTIEPRKNLGNLLEAYAKFCKNNNDVNLVIAGKDGWGNQSISSIVQTLQIKNRVTILGYVDDCMLHALYQNCLALLMPSLYEGFGLPAVEALNYTKPVMAGLKSGISSTMSSLVVNNTDDSAEAILEGLIKIEEKMNFDFSRPELETWNDVAKVTKRILLSIT